MKRLHVNLAVTDLEASIHYEVGAVCSHEPDLRIV